MAAEDHTGQVLLRRIPRPVLVAFMVPFIVPLAHLFGFGEMVANEDLAPSVDKALDSIAALAGGVGWIRLQLAIMDPKKSVID